MDGAGGIFTSSLLELLVYRERSERITEPLREIRTSARALKSVLSWSPLDTRSARITLQAPILHVLVHIERAADTHVSNGRR
jgi:hypothetical protein